MDEDTEPADEMPDEPDWLAAERRQAAEWGAEHDVTWVDRQAAEALEQIHPKPQWGTTEPVSTNGHAPAPEPTRTEELRGALLHGADILNVPAPEPLIEGWLNLDSLAVLYGPPKTGKSFLALDMALCIASGSWWHGHEVTKGPVLYVVAEGVRGVGRRVAAWAAHNRVDVPQDLIWLPRPVSLLSPQWAEALAETAAELAPKFVVIDTLNRSMAGGDENSSKDMGTVIGASDLIKRATGACVKLVHHSGKDAAQGARGHSSLKGAIDTELELKNGGDGIIWLTNSAQKDAAEALPLRFTLAPSGDSVAIAPYRGTVSGDGTELHRNAEQTLQALREIQLPGGVPPGKWFDACEASHSSFYRHVPRLLELGLIANVGTDKAPRYVVAAEPPPAGEPDAA